jgi:outer membrane protein assembly factor BamB
LADFDQDGYWTEAEWNQFRMRGVGEYGFTAISLTDQVVSEDSIKWRYKRGIPYVPSPVVYQGNLYSVRSGGLILAIDAKTGELRKEGRSPQALGEYFASPIAADGKIFLASAEGKMTVLKAGNTWEILDVNDIGDMIFATPAVADKALYVRTKSKLYCFREDAKKRSE